MKSKFVDESHTIAAGDSAPPGASVAAGGVNFSAFSKTPISSSCCASIVLAPVVHDVLGAPR
jgi:hypothetical protein